MAEAGLKGPLYSSYEVFDDITILVKPQNPKTPWVFMNTEWTNEKEMCNRGTV